MQIGILQTGHAPDVLLRTKGDFTNMFQTLLAGAGFTYDTYNVVDMDFPDGAGAADGWLITGSKHGAYEDHAFIPPLEDLIRAIYAARVPLIGVCFGHQIIAQALGGTVEKFSGGWATGHQEYQLNGAPIALNAWHQDQVVAKPAAARVIGSNDFCANAALAYDDHVLTLQPHPEFTADAVQGLIKARGPGKVPEALLHQATENLQLPTQSDQIAQMFTQFFLAAQKVGT